MTQDIRWKQRFDNFKRALKQFALAVELMNLEEFAEIRL